MAIHVPWSMASGIFVYGTTGFDNAKMSISDDLAEQVH
jgi:enamine deaminase RidA (YjgF/YER057c/UK114 family)